MTEKRGNKTKYLTWNSIRLRFAKKTSIANPVKSLGYMKYYSSVSPGFVKSSSNSIRSNCQMICSWSRKSKTKLEIWKKATFLFVINKTIIYNFTTDFTNHTKKTNRTVAFSCRHFPDIFKYRGQQWDLQTMWKTSLLQTHIEEFNWYVLLILCSFRLVLERKICKEISESSRLKFLEKFLANNLALSDAQNNTSGWLKRGRITDLPLLRTLSAIRPKFLEPNFW